MKKPLLILLGPTASGKSHLAIELAKTFNGEIVSADSMQVYKGMDIGTAKPEESEREKIPHHLIDIKNPDENWSVADFIKEANKLIDKISKDGKLPIIAGGTGLYLFSLIYLHNKLMGFDQETAKKLHVNDTKRITRALEVYELTGKPISAQGEKDPLSKKYNIIIIGLNMNREDLYKKIEERIDSMIEKGLIKEVSELKNVGYGTELSSMQALGYKEVMDYLEGRYEKDEMVALLKKRTRNFAKRQMTWFRRFKDIKWFDSDSLSQDIVKFIKEQIS
ncbi:MAG: tRNA (adenosine(37)-N6)-dimethylallyltransferase MiaA [Candidatus Saganbacteria bacterium]|nr:tRNA (adenosine(37)-N6)-dimethylallyltransferase MiaA [Candidatus Saganbacteria bacterium]